MKFRLSRIIHKIWDFLSLFLNLRVGGFLVAAFTVWLFAKIANEVLEKETQAFDRSTLLILRHLHTPLLNQVMIGVTALGQPSALLIVTLSLGIWLFLKRHRPEAIALAIGAVGSLGLNYLLKELFRRARPPIWEHVISVTQFSFPSGHAMMSLVVYGLSAYLLSNRFYRWRVPIFSFSILLILAIGFSRLYLGVHWPSDVAAGYAAGIAWLMACILELEISRRRR
ncbi:MAG: phosphatase PAP2 family protein [Chroococcidiopsidaceae cyanobacterium CP_BM_ER_R8_30]|nr:phosphatase PAP2 family protein [Chroococcidiopsidaceae cyanobacterium CP_BM_ER_R8_30]